MVLDSWLHDDLWGAIRRGEVAFAALGLRNVSDSADTRDRVADLP